MNPRSRNARKEFRGESDHRKSGEVKTHCGCNVAAVCQRPWSRLIGDQLIRGITQRSIELFQGSRLRVAQCWSDGTLNGSDNESRINAGTQR